MTRYKIILNPTAGKGNGLKVRPQIEEILTKYKLDYDIDLTGYPEHAIELARKAAEDGFDVVVAAGGDGTANEVLNGLMQFKQSHKKCPLMAALPVGRGNDFAFGAGIPIGVQESCDLLASGLKKKIDIGKVTGGLHPQGLYFGNGVGIGFDAVVGFVAAKSRLTGMLSYLVAAVKTIFIYYKPPMVDVILENKTFQISALLVSIMNGRRMGGGFMMAPDAKPNDGIFDLCLVRSVPQSAMFGLIGMVMKGTQSTHPAVSTAQSKKVIVRAIQGTVPAHADGVTVCEAGQELTIEILADELEIITRLV
ncbi:MAG: diacylglycerol kinase [Chloroflexi bacterium]|nr:MAG: diacylglycerol kinase [Chloroflexota bacterium]MBA4376847.1 diacylglycerol kinase [Anaerolinea sp.]